MKGGSTISAHATRAPVARIARLGRLGRLARIARLGPAGRVALWAALLVAPLGVTAPACAQMLGLPRSHSLPEAGSAFTFEEPPTAFIAQRGGISLAQATAIAQSRYRGRVVRAETVQQGDRVVHEIRILGDDGRVRTVRVDAQTGAVM